ncbi:FAD-dependent oxidoreductase [Atopobium deltae]|nr:FAD-dependent oxidoreductase [Atopobium deltae]
MTSSVSPNTAANNTSTAAATDNTTAADNLYDAVIVGGGPAGLTAAIYLARARYRVLVVEKNEFGGQINLTNEVVNYPGVERTSGRALTTTMRKQAEAFGAELLLAEATGFELNGDIKTVHTTQGDLRCFGVLLTCGCAPRTLGFPGEETFRGRGVAYCATCDGEFFTGKDIFVVGGGFAAAEESVFLAKYGTHVHILMRTDDFTCAASAADGARANKKITIHPNTEVVEVTGDSVPRSLKMRNNKTGEEIVYNAPNGDTFGLFILAGYAPATGLLCGLIELDHAGNINTDKHNQTSVEGVYAAGDVTIKNLRQVTTAVGEAARTATEMERHLASMQHKLGIIPQHPVSRITASREDRELANTDANATSTTAPAGSAITADSASNATATATSLFDSNTISQLKSVFDRMQRSLVFKLTLDDRPISQELEAYCKQIVSLTDKITIGSTTKVSTSNASGDTDSDVYAPSVHIFTADGNDTGLAFHGVPGGHEFTPFVLGLYNAAGPGQALDDATRTAIQAIKKPTKIQVLTSLTCTMCPDTVVAAQRIASLNNAISAEVYDVSHFGQLKDRYNVMSVPCIIINDGEKIEFGRKSVEQMLAIIR